MRDTFLIVDGNSLMHRAFHALPLLDYKGTYTNALQGFFSMLFKVFQEDRPQYCAVCFDEHGPTFRHTAYAEYKAGRKPTPEELRPQFPLLKQLLGAMGIGVYSLPGYEADDLLGTLSLQSKQSDVRALMLTGDRDALQLVDDDNQVLFTRRGITETMLFTPEEVFNQFGVTPAQVPDWKGLAGDASDNIPGVPGVGDKTAVKLLQEYGCLESVLEHAAQVKGKLGEKLRDNREQALFSKELATIRRTAPIQADFAACRLNRLAGGMELMDSLGMATMKKRLKALSRPAPLEGQAGEKAAYQAEQIAFSPWEELSAVAQIEAAAKEGAELKAPAALYLGDALTFAFADGRRFRVTVEGDLFNPGISPRDALNALTPLMQAAPLIVHDGKKLRHLMERQGLEQPGEIRWDTMLGAYLINPQEKSYSLSGFSQGGEEDASQAFNLYLRQRAVIEEQGMLELMEKIELPLSKVLFQMEREGFRVDREALSQLGAEFTARIEALKRRVYELTGVTGFNLNSPQQLGRVLFEVLQLPHGKKSKTGSYSTSADILEGLLELHPAIAPLLEYRQLVKLNGTYVDGLLRLMDRDGRVRTTFDQTATATGRISSNEPNLQNIPVRTEQGREIRRAFVPRDGWLLVDADYSQIELRILAHLSGDPAMTEAFQKGQDVHTRTASEVFGVPMEEVTPQMRSRAKAVNFGLVYGISDFGLARNTGVSRGEAAEFIQMYFARYPGVKRFMDEAVAKGQTEGYAVTLMGRRRYLPELASSRAAIRDFGKRAAMNTPVQGAAADIIKLAMVRVDEALKSAKLRARMTLQVHDELIIECPPEEKDRVAALLKECMENVTRLSVPLTAEVNWGKTWYDTK